MNKEFNFIYQIDSKKNILSYHLERKDKKEFAYYQKYVYELPIELGVISNNYKIDNNDNRYIFFMTNGGNHSISQYRDKNNMNNSIFFGKKFTMVNKINETIKINNAINLLRNYNNESTFISEKDIYFTVRIPLDNELNTCLVYQTDKIRYNFGNKYYWDFRYQFNHIFYWE